jgi:hypothetical protein
VFFSLRKSLNYPIAAPEMTGREKGKGGREENRHLLRFRSRDTTAHPSFKVARGKFLVKMTTLSTIPPKFKE